MTVIVGYEYFGRPYVYGEAPGPSEGAPLSGVRKSLGKLTRRSYDEMAEIFTWVNLLESWPGYGPSGGSLFPARDARAAALEQEEMFERHFPGNWPRRIYLGRRVARAFRFDAEWLVWKDDQAVCPHPSGLNRWWNSSDNRERARAFWEEAIA